MKVLVDTNVWSLALRRNSFNKNTDTLKNLILSYQAVIIGPIRQELLSGISDDVSFNILKSKIDYFDDFPITSNDYVNAAKFFNICRKHGVQGSMIDFLISAVAYENNMLIYTEDKDFVAFSKYIPIKLFISQ